MVKLDAHEIVHDDDVADLKSVFRPVDESQWGKLQVLECHLRALSALYQHVAPCDPRAEHLLEQCWTDLRRARKCIERRVRWRRRFEENHVLFLQLVHRIDEDLLLIVPISELAPAAAEVLNDFERNISDAAERGTWLGTEDKPGLLRAARRAIMAELTKKLPGGSPASILEAERQQVRHALGMVNRASELAFQQLNFAILMRAFSAVALVATALGVFAIRMFCHAIGDRDPVWQQLLSEHLTEVSIVLLGSIGAFLSIILSEEPQLRTRGPARRHLFHSLCVRPIIGMAAAFFVFLVAQAQGILQTRDEASSEAPAGAVVEPRSGQSGLIRIKLPPLGSKAPGSFAIYAVLSIVVGYGAQRRFGGLMDEVLDKIYARADKKMPTPPDLQQARA